MYLDPVARLRRFNRAVVRAAGALDTSCMGRGRPLGAARVLHLVQPEGTDVAVIRAKLGLDSGLMSRFLRALEREKLIETTPNPADRRRSIARLTPAGEAEMAAIEADARVKGFTALKLDTNSALTEAVALYRAGGWVEIAPYTAPPADTWLGKAL